MPAWPLAVGREFRICLHSTECTSSTMVKTTRRERRKKAIASGAAEARGVSKVKAKIRTPPTASSGSKQQAPALVGKNGKPLVKRPAARKQQGGGGKAGRKNSPSKGADGRKNKRPRSQVEEVGEDEEADDAQAPVIVDELVATIQEYDKFFSRMLDMIPEHLVLPSKEVTESSYSSKYMKVGEDSTQTISSPGKCCSVSRHQSA